MRTTSKDSVIFMILNTNLGSQTTDVASIMGTIEIVRSEMILKDTFPPTAMVTANNTTLTKRTYIENFNRGS